MKPGLYLYLARALVWQCTMRLYTCASINKKQARREERGHSLPLTNTWLFEVRMQNNNNLPPNN
jgi:hypothetical protein